MSAGIRVGCLGSSGTGKSTIAHWIAESYGLAMNPVGSRSVARAMGFASPYDVDTAGRRIEFQRTLQAEKIRWELDHEDFVTDRTTLDELAYTWPHATELARSPEYYDAAVGHVSRYGLIIYCPLEAFCSLAGDPDRRDDLRYQHLFDAHVSGLLDKCADVVPVLTLADPGLDARKNLVCDVMRELFGVHPIAKVEVA